MYETAVQESTGAAGFAWQPDGGGAAERPRAPESAASLPPGGAESGRTTAAGEPQQAVRGKVFLRGVLAGRSVRLQLAEGLTSLGSHADNTVAIDDDPCVSRFHCRLHLREDGRLTVRDLGSRNGTFVDGLRVAEAEVSAGATLRLGGRTFTLERGAPARSEVVPGFVTRDERLRAALSLLARAAPTRIPIVLSGESGTGKEVAARGVHELSQSARGPFVALNCGAISAELAESELFGHERGAFTGAVGQSAGAFGAADGGTLFLDEIGDLPLHLQVKLLRALESSEVKPVGAARPRSVDVRVVSASHRDLRELVRQGAFREDLFFRLRGLVVELPPLRERPHDVLPLAEHFLAAEPEGRGCALSADAREALQRHSWPGNARELRHAVRLGLALCEGRLVRAADLRLDDAPDAGRAAGAEEQLPRAERATMCREAPVPGAGAGAGARGSGPAPLEAGERVALRGRTLHELEAMAIRAAWHRYGGSRRTMCSELGISRSNLVRKLIALGLRAPQERGDDATGG